MDWDETESEKKDTETRKKKEREEEEEWCGIVQLYSEPTSKKESDNEREREKRCAPAKTEFMPVFLWTHH